MFGNNFPEEDICGLFTWGHFLAMVISFSLLVVALIFARKLSQKKVWWLFLAIACVITVFEIVKISLRVSRGDGGDGWIPLYFCHMFIPAIWLSLCKNKHLKTCGMTFLVIGGIAGGLLNTLYPSTSLMLYPLYHAGSLYSIFYHWCMMFCGLLLAIKKIYVPKACHFFYYFTLVSAFCGAGAIVNSYLGTNMMFLDNPFGLPLLDGIANANQIAYSVLAYLAQAVALYWAIFGIYLLTKKITIHIKQNPTKKEKKHEPI